MDTAEMRLRIILAQFAVLQEALKQLEFQTIHLAEELGMTRTRIGEAHEPPISHQMVKKRYSHPKLRRQRTSATGNE